ncbi:MAG: hypothetical protein H6719_36770 [Sandaracinaceae bacterium]|nr:hypothetical protein [Sandaracinaceae bacterium]
MSRYNTLLALLAVGCTVDPTVHPSFRDCVGDADCDPGQVCDRGFCLLAQGTDGGGADAGPGPDAAEPLDAGEPMDGGCGVEVLCNGRDDDCDDTIDEFTTTSCETGSPGICGDGTYVCSGGAPVCAGSTLPQPEACNGLDDDCDDAVDELAPVRCYPSTMLGCVDSDGDGDFECAGTCAAGRSTCAGGTLGACEGFVGPVDEACGATPAADDDCDGVIDEGCGCSADQACYGGPAGTQGVGACVGGTQTCTAGELDPACAGQVVPSMETCANPMVDDDCDGVIDDIPREGDPCTATEAVGQCQLGHLGCAGMGPALSCLPAPATEERCDGNDNDCDRSVDEGFDLSNDELNCGACGNACGSDETCCGGSCVDTRSSAGHCGACATDGGATCGGSEVCCNGSCADALSCGTCMDDCGAMGRDCCRGSCVDQQTDEANCGACGNVCGAGQVCCGGACVGSDASHCGQGCGVCTPGSELCCSGSCVTIGNMYCNACGVSCSTGECCDSGCVDLEDDPLNCGACGRTCPGGQICSDGNCCPSGQAWCAAQGQCRDFANDANNCGSCGRTCPALNACCGGVCRLASLGC